MGVADAAWLGLTQKAGARVLDRNATEPSWRVGWTRTPGFPLPGIMLRASQAAFLRRKGQQLVWCCGCIKCSLTREKHLSGGKNTLAAQSV